MVDEGGGGTCAEGCDKEAEEEGRKGCGATSGVDTELGAGGNGDGMGVGGKGPYMGSTEDEEDVSAVSGMGVTAGGLGGCVVSGTAVEVASLGGDGSSVGCEAGSDVGSDKIDDVADRKVCVTVSVTGTSWVAVTVKGA